MTGGGYVRQRRAAGVQAGRFHKPGLPWAERAKMGELKR